MVSKDKATSGRKYSPILKKKNSGTFKTNIFCNVRLCWSDQTNQALKFFVLNGTSGWRLAPGLSEPTLLASCPLKLKVLNIDTPAAEMRSWETRIAALTARTSLP